MKSCFWAETTEFPVTATTNDRVINIQLILLLTFTAF